jgi:hypothetical protein
MEGNECRRLTGHIYIRDAGAIYIHRYLTETAGVALGGRRFQLVYLDWDSAYSAADGSCVDFLFVNPSLYSCLELQFGVSPLGVCVVSKSKALTS